MAKNVERPVIYRRAWMLLTRKITGKTHEAIRKGVYRIGAGSDIERFSEYLKKEIGGQK